MTNLPVIKMIKRQKSAPGLGSQFLRLLIVLCLQQSAVAQNVGIGTSTPGFPLNFANSAGDKISLFGNTGNHYGFGIQSGLLQLHTDLPSSNIVFGYGSSSNFAERMRILNAGTDGMILNGRLLLKNGSLPLDVNQTPGVWLYKADNSGLLGFMGTQNNQNIGFFGGPVNGGWGFTYNGINSRVGIGTSNPTSSLNVNGQITVDQKNFGGYGGLLLKGNVPGSNYPNIAFTTKNNAVTPSDVVAAMIQGDLVNNTAGAETIDLTFLTSNTGLGGLSEKLRIKNNGALVVNGNAGNAGQILTSNGNSGSAQWAPITQAMPVLNTEGATGSVASNNTTASFPSSTSMTINVTQNCNVIIFCNTIIYNSCPIGPCYPTWDFEILLNNASVKVFPIHAITSATRYSDSKAIGPCVINLTPGNNTISFRGFVSTVGGIGTTTNMRIIATAFVIAQ